MVRFVVRYTAQSRFLRQHTRRRSRFRIFKTVSTMKKLYFLKKTATAFRKYLRVQWWIQGAVACAGI